MEQQKKSNRLERPSEYEETAAMRAIAAGEYRNVGSVFWKISLLEMPV